MATLNDYFRTEARDFLNALERSLDRAPAPDPADLHRAVRGLRGTAQMAREQRVFDVVSAFESVTRAISTGALAWSDHIAARARDTIEDLRVLLDTTVDDEQLDARVSDAAARWREADGDPAPPAAPPVIDPDTSEFREFAAKEAAAIADALDRGIADLQANPMDREPLTIILRRQRALLGAARLEEIPVVADILRAVEDLTRVIVKLDVGVKQEWLDIYRVARDALQTTIAPLLRDELPQSSNSVSRLRHMRAELLERYGSTVEEPPPPEDPFARTTTAPTEPLIPPAASAPRAAPVAPPAAPVAPPAAPVTPPAAPVTPPAAPVMPRPASTAPAPAAPFMGPVRSSAPSQPTTHHEPPLQPPSTRQSSFQPPWQPSATQPASSLPTAHAPPPPDLSTSDAAADVLELDESAAAGEQEPEFLDLGEETVVDEDAGMLDLSDEVSVDEDAGMLDLSDEVSVDEDAGMLDLSDEVAAEYDAGMLDLSDEVTAEEDAGTLDLTEDTVIADEAGAPALDVAELVAELPATSAQSSEQILARAIELRDIIARVAAHDPVARAAVDELYDLIRTALR